MAEQVWVQAVDAGLPAAAAEDLADTGVGHTPFLPDPQPLEVCVWVASSSAEVAVER
jgi:hypothetical protein